MADAGSSTETPTTVFIVDDDPLIREALSRLLRSLGWGVRLYVDAADFLGAPPSTVDGCLLLDVSMPGMSGPDLHLRLSDHGVDLPVVYLSGRSTLAIGVDAMKHGASDFLEKPVDEQVLVRTIEAAVARHRGERGVRERQGTIRRHLAQLSRREREVMDHVIQGRLNKQIAADLGIAEKTVKIHRRRAMDKMDVRSVAQLVRMCDLVGLGVAPETGAGRSVDPRGSPAGVPRPGHPAPLGVRL